jgi:hypothetical protein
LDISETPSQPYRHVNGAPDSRSNSQRTLVATWTAKHKTRVPARADLHERATTYVGTHRAIELKTRCARGPTRRRTYLVRSGSIPFRRPRVQLGHPVATRGVGGARTGAPARTPDTGVWGADYHNSSGDEPTGVHRAGSRRKRNRAQRRAGQLTGLHEKRRPQSTGPLRDDPNRPPPGHHPLLRLDYEAYRVQQAH